MKQFAVIGLGRFGSSLATTLAERGQQVLAIDKNEELVHNVMDIVSKAVCLNATDEKALKSVGLQGVDVAICGIGTNLENSILVTLLLKDLNVPEIICKADSMEHKKVLEKIGATKVILPEKDTGELKMVEKVFLRSLFPSGKPLPVDKESHSELLSAKRDIRDHISGRRKEFFLRNWGWVATGLLATVLLIGGSGVLMGVATGDIGFVLVSMVIFTGWTIGVSVFVYNAFRSLREGIRRRKFGQIIRGIFFVSIYLSPF